MGLSLQKNADRGDSFTVTMLNLFAQVNNFSILMLLLLAPSFSHFISSDRSSYCDDGLLYIYPRPLFQFFTQSLHAIDVTSVTLSCLNSINSFDVTRCKLKLIECRMFQCSNVPMIQCSNVQIGKLERNCLAKFIYFRVPIFKLEPKSY